MEEIPLLLALNDPQLYGFGDSKFILELRQNFFTRLTSQQREINQAILKQDWKSTQELAHHILGACIYCGAPRLQKMAEEIVAAIRQNKNPLPQALVDQFNDVVEATLRALRQ